MLEELYGTVWSCMYTGVNRLEVFPVSFIMAVVTVVPFDHSTYHTLPPDSLAILTCMSIAIRRRRPGVVDDSPQKRQPVPQVHVDQTAASATARVHRHLPAEDAPELLKHRFQIINLWRPIGQPAWDWPLALCDYRSVDPKQDLIPTRLIYPDREGETFGVKYNPNHRWKYLKGMSPEEFVLIKWYVCYDSISMLRGTHNVVASTRGMMARPPS